MKGRKGKGGNKNKKNAFKLGPSSTRDGSIGSFPPTVRERIKRYTGTLRRNRKKKDESGKLVNEGERREQLRRIVTGKKETESEERYGIL